MQLLEPLQFARIIITNDKSKEIHTPVVPVSPHLESEIPRETFRELRELISGGIALPGDDSYEGACKIWNGAILHRPAVIAFCKNTDDVQASVRFARRHDVPLSVRGGGHDWAGRALSSGGLVIDLTGMRQVTVDPVSRVATVAGGSTAKDVALSADAHGLVAALGNCGEVGLAGLTLGGGYGPLNGSYGLASDNLLSAEVVLADGRCVFSDPDVEPELFWAIRGGGGNFGVVTSLRIRLHAVQHLLTGMVVFSWVDVQEVLRRYATFAASAPDELGLPVALTSTPDGMPMMLCLPLWHGDQQSGERYMRDLQALGSPQAAQIGVNTYGNMLAHFDASLEPTSDCHWETRTRSLGVLTPKAIDTIVRAMAQRTSPFSMVNWHHFHGASTRIAANSTAFGLRSEHFMLEIIAAWMPGEDDGEKHKQWAQDLWESLAPFSLPGGYANYLTSEARDSEQAKYAYGKNGGQLRSLKNHFDPQNAFISALPLPIHNPDEPPANSPATLDVSRDGQRTA